MGKWTASAEQRRAWARKYNMRHRRRRAIAAVRVSKGEGVCWRCGLPIDPDEPWELGHDDDGLEHRSEEHRFCNRSAAGKRTRERHSRRTSLEL